MCDIFRRIVAIFIALAFFECLVKTDTGMIIALFTFMRFFS